MAVYKSEVCIKDTPRVLFEFFLNPNNLVEITLPSLKLKILDAPEKVEVGSIVEFQVTQLAFDLKATHEVVLLEEYCITQKQVTGPMKEFQHERRFVEVGDANCRIENTVTFERPGGMLGAVMHQERIISSLDESFEYQNSKLQEKFGSAE